MFNEFYDFRKANVEHPINDQFLVATHNYTFKAGRTPYIVQVEQYIGNIYVIKFFRKQDRRNRKKFSILTNENKCTKIVSTCIRILISILEKDEMASFGFLGAHTIADGYEEPKEETQRFRIYKGAMENLIGDQVFEHSMDLVHSTYLMVNKLNESTDDFIANSRIMFDKIFPELAD